MYECVVARMRQLASVSGPGTALCAFLFVMSCRSDQRNQALPLPKCIVGFPAELQGPIDSALPTFGCINYASACSGARGRAGIVWVRGLDRHAFQWDETLRVWHVRGSDETVTPHRRSWDVRASDAQPVLRERDVFTEGQFVGMCVLGPSGVEASGLLPGIGPESGHVGDLVGEPVSCGGGWQLPLALWPRGAGVIGPATHGIAIATFDECGWRSPRMLVPEKHGSGAWLFADDGHTDVFWREYYHRPFDLPDFMGGIQRERLQHARITEACAPVVRTAYDFPTGPPWVTEARAISMGDRFDLALRRETDRGKHATAPVELIYVSNLLGWLPGSHTTIGHCELNSEMKVLTLSDQGLQVLWLEEVGWHGDVERRSYQLVETHLDGHSWSVPRAVWGDRGPCHYEGLAATTFQMGAEQLIFVLWPGEGGRLTYTIGSGWDGWSGAVATDLVIGSPNWVVDCDGRLALITRMKNNLYWCYFTVEQLSSPPQKSLDSVT
jgi:hypothetical protein